MTRLILLAAVVAVAACNRRTASAPDAAKPAAEVPAPLQNRRVEPAREPVRGEDEPLPEPEERPLSPEREREALEKMKEEPPPDEVSEPRDLPPEERGVGPDAGAAPEPRAEPGPGRADAGPWKIEDLLRD